MRIAVCIPPSPGDAYGHLARYAKKLARAAAPRGIPVEILRYPEENFFARLFGNLLDEECIVHFYGFLYDLRVSTASGGPEFIHAIDTAKAPTVATIGDHPFSLFMRNMIRHAHAKTKFIVMDRAFPDEMQALNPNLRDSHYEYQPISPPTNYDESLFRDFDSRGLDLFVPMWIVDHESCDINGLLAKFENHWFGEVLRSTYERAIENTEESLFHIFVDCLKNRTSVASLDEVRVGSPEGFDLVLNGMGALDGIIRHERRRKMVSRLLKSVGNLKVAVTSSPDICPNVDPNVKFLGNIPVSEVVQQMANARAILNTNPTYPTGLHERVTGGMMYESCVITDINPCIRDAFSPGEFVPYDPDATMTLPELFEEHDVSSVANAGARKVRTVRDFSWDAHIDGLMRLAAA